MGFDLKSISKTRRLEAPKILLAGEPKIGKSTFAASAPQAVGILTEDGMSGIDAQAFPLAQSLPDVYQAFETLLTTDHQFQTVFIDSLDWLEPLINQHVCNVNKWDSIESPGFGKGYVAAAAEWRNVLDGLELLRRERGMGVILICHVKVQRIETPTNDGYDAYVLKLHSRASALVEEWADIVGFAAHRIKTKQVDAGFGNKETKALKSTERVLHLEPHPAYPSGSRFGLRDCQLTWEAFADQLNQALNP